MIVGGENLLEKAEEQARLLEESNRELEERRMKEAELRRALAQKQVSIGSDSESTRLAFTSSM